MNTPKFTAEASLYLSNRPYASLAFTFGTGSVVAPLHQANLARPVCEPTCGCNTYDYPVPTCAKLCIDHPRGDPYAVECDPSECNPPCQGQNCCSPGCVQC